MWGFFCRKNLLKSISMCYYYYGNLTFFRSKVSHILARNPYNVLLILSIFWRGTPFIHECIIMSNLVIKECRKASSGPDTCASIPQVPGVTFTSASGMNSEVCCFLIMLLKNDTIFANLDPVDCTAEAHSFLLVIFLTFLVNIQEKIHLCPKELLTWKNIQKPVEEIGNWFWS